MKKLSEAPNQANAAASGAAAVSKALGARTTGSATAKALGSLEQGKATAGAATAAIAPYADVLNDILANTKYRGMFLKMISMIKADQEKEAQKALSQPSQITGANPQAAQRPVQEDADPVDTVTVDVPLLLRVMEYAKEDAQDDLALHDVAEAMVRLSKNNEVLSMDHYETIVGDDSNLPVPADKMNETYGYTAGEPTSDENVSYSQTKRSGNATVTVSANAKDMEELHRILKLAGLDVPALAGEHEAEVEVEEPCGCEDMPPEVEIPAGPQPLALKYSTDKTALLNAIKDKLAQRLS